MANVKLNEPAVGEANALSEKMFDMVIGLWKSNFIYAAVKLDVADHLHNNAMTAEELAAVTKTHAPSLNRLMRTLASMELFTEDEDKKFHLTPLGATLRTGVRGSFKYTVINHVEESDWWSEFLYTIQTGKPGFDKKFGMTYWQYLAKNPYWYENFRNAIDEDLGNYDYDIPKFYDFTQHKHIVDIAGNDGTFLMHVLERTPQAKGTLFDLPTNIAAAKVKVAANSAVKDRITFQTGSFLETIPANGDCYMLKGAICDWDDDDTLTIFKNIRKQMTKNSVFLMMISLLPEGNEEHPGKMWDLYFMWLVGGREKTRRQYEALFKKAGLKVRRVIHTNHKVSHITEVVIDE